MKIVAHVKHFGRKIMNPRKAFEQALVKFASNDDWPISLKEYEKAVKNFSHKAGADYISAMGLNLGIHMSFHNWRDADARPTRVGFTLMTLYKRYEGSLQFGIYTQFQNKSKNRILTKEFYGPDDKAISIYAQFVKRLNWTVSALEKMKQDGILVPNEY